MTVMVFFTSVNQDEISKIWNWKCSDEKVDAIGNKTFNLKTEKFDDGSLYVINGNETNNHDIELELCLFNKIKDKQPGEEFIIFYHADNNKWNAFKNKLNYTKNNILYCKQYGGGEGLWNNYLTKLYIGDRQAIFAKLINEIRDDVATQNISQLRYNLLSQLVALDLILQFKNENTGASFAIEADLKINLIQMKKEKKEIGELCDKLIINDEEIKEKLIKQFDSLMLLRNGNAEQYHNSLIAFADEIGELVDAY